MPITTIPKKYVVVSSTAPTNPFDGQYWRDTSNNQLKMYNASSGNWELRQSVRSDTEPSNPVDGLIWIDTSGNNTETNQYDSGSSSWELIMARGSDSPEYPVAGSLWRDTGAGKLKQYDGSSWATVGNTIDNNSIVENTSGEIKVNDIIFKNYSFDFSALSYSGELSITSYKLLDCCWGDNGNLFFSVDNTNLLVHKYSLSTAYDLSTATEQQTLDFSSLVSDNGYYMTGITISSDGSKLILLEAYNNSDNATIYKYNLSTSFDLSTGSKDQEVSVSSNISDGRALIRNSDGSKFFVADNGGYIEVFELSTPYDLSTLSHTNSLDFTGDTTNLDGFNFADDGNYLLLNNGDVAIKYSLSTAYDPSTSSKDASLDFSSEGALAYSLIYNNTGSTLYIYYTSFLIYKNFA